MVLTNEDIELIEKLEKILNKGYYADGKEVTDLYNKIFEQHLTYTNCSSCLRTRISKMVGAKNNYLKQLEVEAPKAEEPQPKKRGRKKKNESGQETLQPK